MPETTLTLPEGAVSVAEIVAREFASHEAHTRQKFAQDAARTLLGMRPAARDDATRAAAAALDSAARVVLMLAGLGSAGVRMTPDVAGTLRTIPDEVGQARTEANHGG